MTHKLSIAAIDSLRRYQRNVRGKEYIKVTGILMLAKGYSPESVSECLGIASSTVYRYWLHYREVGLDIFFEMGFSELQTGGYLIFKSALNGNIGKERRLFSCKFGFETENVLSLGQNKVN